MAGFRHLQKRGEKNAGALPLRGGQALRVLDLHDLAHAAGVAAALELGVHPRVPPSNSASIHASTMHLAISGPMTRAPKQMTLLLLWRLESSAE